MKTFLSILITIITLTCLISCGVISDINEITDATKDVIDYYDEIEDYNFEDEDSQDVSSDVSNADWQQLLKEYEDWVDEYVSISKKYSENPSDLSIMSDYFDMLGEMVEWAERTETMQESLDNASSADIAEYAKELARIANKLAEAAY